ncbi:response regulator [Candidatus Nomurabacteria bacterium]|nr:response regulator [Candidatus Nomurabacteria bacterium]
MTKILMVEDFPVIQKFYKDALVQAGYELEVVPDGLQALAKVAEFEYDIILLDMLLPNLNGVEFLEKFSNRPAHTKIIALSDFTEPGRIKRAYELGVAEYLVKSEYPPSELVLKIDKLVAGEDDGSSGEEGGLGESQQVKPAAFGADELADPQEL